MEGTEEGMPLGFTRAASEARVNVCCRWASKLRATTCLYKTTAARDKRGVSGSFRWVR